MTSSPMTRISLSLTLAAGMAFASAFFCGGAKAAPIIKENNTDNLNLGSSWVGGIAPGAGDRGVWNATVVGANTTNLGASQTWQGIDILNPGGLVTVNVGSGQTLTLSGTPAGTNALVIDNSATAGAITQLAITGATAGVGSLVINNTIANNNDFLMTNTSNTAPNSMQSFNLTGLGSFTATVESFLAGTGAGRPVVEVTLADNANVITANAIRIGAASGTATSGSFLMGQSNTLNANTIAIANARTNADFTFRSDLVGTPTATIRATNGTGRADLILGNNSTQFGGVAGGSSAPLATADFTAGSVDFLLDELILGIAGSVASNTVGHGRGVLTFDQGTVDATTVVVGRAINITAAANPDVSAAVHGMINVEGGTFNAGSITIAQNQDLDTGANALIRGELNIAGGATSVTGNVTVGIHTGATPSIGVSDAKVNITGGSLTVGGNLLEGASLTADGPTDISTLTLNGGTLDMTAGTINVDTFNLQSGTLRNLAQFNSGGVTGAELVKTSPGTVTVEGTNSYTGDTTVQEGKFVVNGSITGTGAVAVKSGATIGGTGSVAGTVTIEPGGTDAPGASVGTGMFANAIWKAGGAFEFEINNAVGTPGVDWDLRQVLGNLNLSDLSNGPFIIEVVGTVPDFDSGQNYEWEFVTADSFTVGSVDLDDLAAIFSIDDSGFTNSLDKGQFAVTRTDNGLAISFFAAVPEPASISLWMLLGATGLAWYRWKCRRLMRAN